MLIFKFIIESKNKVFNIDLLPLFMLIMQLSTNKTGGRDKQGFENWDNIP